MNSYQRGLRNAILVNPKLFILEKVNLGPHINCWSNLVKRFKNLYYLVRVVTQTLCRDKISPSSIELCMSFVAMYSCWLRHSSFGMLEFCVATYENYVATKTTAFSTFFILFALFSLIFQLKPAKHKVLEYSTIWHKNRS